MSLNKPSRFSNFWFTLFSLALGVGCSMLLALILGENPLDVVFYLMRGAFGNLNHIGYTLYYATPLIFTGLSVAVAFQGGLFNIGAEGQLYVGALFLTAVGILLPRLPLSLGISMGIAVSLLGGALWGAVAGWMRAYRGSHEVIATIMLNFISYSIVSFFIFHIFKNQKTQNAETLPIAPPYFLAKLGRISENTPVNVGTLLALIVAFFVWIILFKTKWGFELRLCGSSPQTAERAGIPLKRRLVEVMALSGALAGLVGVNEIMGFSHKLKDQFSPGYGFMGIAVALVGRNSPLGVVLAALFFGALQKGSLELEIDSDIITRDVAGVMQAMIIFFVASEPFWRKLFFSPKPDTLKNQALKEKTEAKGDSSS